MMRVLERKASDNEYPHKDFHGALCYAIKYLDETYGQEATTRYLKQVGKENYLFLTDEIKKRGIVALAQHFKKIFELEDGKAELTYDGDHLRIDVLDCPAIKHLRATGQLFTHRYCETTVQANRAICESSGYNCSCEYKPGRGQCTQIFWKKGHAK